MSVSCVFVSFVVAWLLPLGGCATREVNPPIAKYHPGSLQQFQRQRHRGDQQDLVTLAFSGRATRTAAFSYGVLETLRQIEIVTNVA